MEQNFKYQWQTTIKSKFVVWFYLSQLLHKAATGFRGQHQVDTGWICSDTTSMGEGYSRFREFVEKAQIKNSLRHSLTPFTLDACWIQWKNGQVAFGRRDDKLT